MTEMARIAQFTLERAAVGLAVLILLKVLVTPAPFL